MDKPHKYIILSIILFLLSIVLLILSICSFMPSKLADILQGMATGLLSGMVLLLITGTKSQEQKIYDKYYEALHICRHSFSITTKTYEAINNIIEYKLYESFEDLSEKIDDMYSNYQSACLELCSIESKYFRPVIGDDFKKYFRTLEKSLGEICENISKAKNTKDINTLLEIVQILEEPERQKRIISSRITLREIYQGNYFDFKKDIYKRFL